MDGLHSKTKIGSHQEKAIKGNCVSLNNITSIQKKHNLEIHKSSKMNNIKVIAGMALREKKNWM